jgi:TatD DNase family protein
MNLTDTHAHLDYSDYDADRDAVVERAKQAHVSQIITIGIGRDSIPRSLQLSEKYNGVYAVVGVHPTDLEALRFDEWPLLEKAAIHPRVVAIGETGLDYHRLPQENVAEFKALQRKYFLRQLALAKSVNKPVVIHCRDAYEDTLAILREFGFPRANAGVMHCFSSDLQTAQQVLDLGFSISVGGVLTFKNAEDLRQVVKAIPHDQLLLETDCPYLAPLPYRGKRNEPAYTWHVAEKLAELWNLPIEKTLEQIEKNVRRVFGI